MDFYSITGDVICYLDDGKHIYLWDGKAVAYLAENRVYAFSGRQLGWFEQGWLYDRSTQPALFSSEAHGGPPRPVRKVRPVRNAKQAKPQKVVRQIGLAKAARSFDWSPFSGAAYFDQ